MSEQDEKSGNDTKNVSAQNAPPTKSRWKMHLALSLVLGISTWAFWTYSPVALQFKQSVFGSYLEQSVASNQPTRLQAIHNTPSPSSVIPTVAPPNSQAPTQTPTFQAMPEPQHLVEPFPPSTQALTQHTATIQQSLEQLQQQVAQLNEHLNKLQHQQAQHTQMQVRVQLFSALVQASSPNSSLNDMILAWKSITFMPLLSAEKRAFAIEALNALQETQDTIYAEQEEAQLLIEALSQQLKSDEILASNSPTTSPQQTSDPYQMVAQRSWFAWISDQFHLTKVKQEHPKAKNAHASTQQVIYHLQQYQAKLQNEQWQSVAELPLLIYQLEQRGMMSELSMHHVKQAQITKQTWQHQALNWMASL